ncbi:hypothetical protein GCM10010363_22040 [Streptomyces omiyaensis]|nr:hypothetical protein GCM10010363_22040 [Streptomyces omiyaensis]
MYGKKSFGAVLRGLRQRGRLTMEELAEASGASVRAIGEMERGAVWFRSGARWWRRRRASVSRTTSGRRC